MRAKAKLITFALSAMCLAGCGGGGGGTLEFTVTFDVDGGSAVAAQKVAYGQKATRPSNPTKDGYTFDNWFADKYKKVEFDFNMEITADWTIYASWTASSTPSSSEVTPTSSEQPEESSQAPVENKHIVYFKEASWWAQDGARTSIYLWKDADKNADWPGQVMTKEADGLWSFEIDVSAYDNLIFARYAASDGGDKDWGAKSVDISIASIDWEKPVYDISAVTSPIWGDPGVTGVWSARA